MNLQSDRGGGGNGKALLSFIGTFTRESRLLTVHELLIEGRRGRNQGGGVGRVFKFIVYVDRGEYS